MESDNYQSIKLKLMSVIRDDNGDPMTTYNKINNAVYMMNRICIHTLQFIKLYILYCDTMWIVFPKAERPFIIEVMKTTCVRRHIGRPPKPETVLLRDVLNTFYQNHYLPSIPDEEVVMTL